MTKDGPLWMVLLSVGMGAALGAMLRWGLSYCFNAKWSMLPLGTMLANWLGAYLIGMAIAWFMSSPSMSPLLKLFLVTGFLGGLTTFSTFSAESYTMLASGLYLRAILHMSLHFVGSVSLCALGAWSCRFLLR